MSEKKSNKLNRRNFLKAAGAAGIVAGAGVMIPKDTLMARSENGKGKMSYGIPARWALS